MADPSWQAELLKGVVNLFVAAIIAAALIDGGKYGLFFGLTVLILNLRTITRNLDQLAEKPAIENDELKPIRVALERIRERLENMRQL